MKQKNKNRVVGTILIILMLLVVIGTKEDPYILSVPKAKGSYKATEEIYDEELSKLSDNKVKR